jgi:hypothetical protein
MARATQLTVALENKVGMLAKLAGVLKRAKVNIEAIAVADAADVCVVRLVPGSAGKAAAALKKAGLAATRNTVVTAKLPNEAGALADAAGKLARAKVNILHCYGSTAAKGKKALVVFAVDDPAKADKALK